MQDRRSLPPHEDELSLALLRSAEHDEPSAAAYSKVAAALGVSAVGVGASVPAAQAAALSNAGAGGRLARFTGSVFGKALVVGVSSALLVVGGVALRRHFAAGNRVAVAAAPSVVAPLVLVPVAASLPAVADLANAPSLAETPAEPRPASAPPISAALASAEDAPTPPQKTNPSPPARKVSAVKGSLVTHTDDVDAEDEASVARAAKASSLPEQVASLDRARMALGAGDSAATLAEISHYRSTWPRGVFLTEASVLEIQALAKRGEIVLAGMRAKAFVTAHPDSPQADRLRQLIPPSSR